MSHNTHHFEFKTLRNAWKALKYFIVGLSCLYKFNLKSLVQMALSALAMLTLVSLTLTAIIYISIGFVKTGPMPTPTIQPILQPQNHTSPPPTKHSHNPTHPPIQGTTPPHSTTTDINRRTPHNHLTNKTQESKTKGPPIQHATGIPFINSQKINSFRTQQNHSDPETPPHVPCSTCSGDSACPSFCQDSHESLPTKASTITSKKIPKSKITKRIPKTSIHYKTNPRNNQHLNKNMTTLPQGLFSSPKHNKNQSTTQVPIYTSA
nr:MAG: attachment glycoprotein [Bovine orthopneumovirus]